ncbi:hypothetical protein IE53DRAFT_121743 [Violaceomyces palustris]|uniref:Uncharacterized protein n=1 Tax=Violaceomyces palustris TaxID=1673888 RepID=A0ACD0P6F3_9BASI|nr:hypothetical protein IE53DRAFT_121743 [Violaceomyces palustris]
MEVRERYGQVLLRLEWLLSHRSRNLDLRQCPYHEDLPDPRMVRRERERERRGSSKESHPTDRRWKDPPIPASVEPLPMVRRDSISCHVSEASHAKCLFLKRGYVESVRERSTLLRPLSHSKEGALGFVPSRPQPGNDVTRYGKEQKNYENDFGKCDSE